LQKQLLYAQPTRRCNASNSRITPSIPEALLGVGRTEKQNDPAHQACPSYCGGVYNGRHLHKIV